MVSPYGVCGRPQFVMVRIADTLKAYGSSMYQEVRATVWLADLEEFSEFKQENAKRFSSGFPVRSTVRGELYRGALIKIEVQALFT